MYQAKGFDYYEDYSPWDTYRGVHPLLTILEPARTAHMMESLVKKARQGGWLPIFPCWNHYTAAMIGDHAALAIGDAYVKGIRNFDFATAYQFMRKNAFQANKDTASYRSGKGRRAMDSYSHLRLCADGRLRLGCLPQAGAGVAYPRIRL